MIVRQSFVLAILLSFTSTAAAGAVNRCDDPYWKDTLRCVFFPNDLPQPNLTDVPSNAQQLADFTRVFLDADPNVRCTDGTTPLMYVD